MHLAGDAGAFRGGGESGLLVAFDLQAAGAVLQGLGVVAAGADRHADEYGHGDGHELRADLLVPAALAVAGDRHEDRGDEQGRRPPQVVQRAAQCEVVDGDQLEQGGLEGGAGPGVDEGEGGHGGEDGAGMGAAPEEGHREAEAHEQQEPVGDVHVVGDVAPSTAAVVGQGCRHPEAGEVQVPQQRVASVEGAHPACDAVGVLGEGLRRPVFRHGVHRAGFRGRASDDPAS